MCVSCVCAKFLHTRSISDGVCLGLVTFLPEQIEGDFTCFKHSTYGTSRRVETTSSFYLGELTLSRCRDVAPS